MPKNLYNTKETRKFRTTLNGPHHNPNQPLKEETKRLEKLKQSVNKDTSTLQVNPTPTTNSSINNASTSEQIQQDGRDVQQHQKPDQQAKCKHRGTTKTPLQDTR